MFEGEATRRSPASQSARIRRHAPHCGGWLVCRAVAPFHIVKMRRRSLRSSFLRNYREALSFSLRVVGVLYPHTPTLLPCFFPVRSFCQGIAPKIFACEGITPSRSLWGYYTPTPPHYCSVSSPCARFVKELRRKISRATPAKIFAPLTPTENSIINTRAERSPAPRLNRKKTHPVYCLNLFF